jgi:hypothetical protein
MGGFWALLGRRFRREYEKSAVLDVRSLDQLGSINSHQSLDFDNKRVVLKNGFDDFSIEGDHDSISLLCVLEGVFLTTTGRRANSSFLSPKKR